MNGDSAGDGRDGGPGSSADGDLSARLKRLGAVLETKRSAFDREAPKSAPASNANAIGQAFRYSAEFVAGVVAGGIVGWLVDRLVGSSPWGLILFLILGFCAGMLNLLRASGTVKPARSDRG